LTLFQLALLVKLPKLLVVWEHTKLIGNVESMLLLFRFLGNVGLVVLRESYEKEPAVADVGHIQLLSILDRDHGSCTTDGRDSGVSLLDH